MDKQYTLPGFNPSGSDVVANIKEYTDNLMDYILDNCPATSQRDRAIYKLEEAAMLAVKSNFV